MSYYIENGDIDQVKSDVYEVQYWCKSYIWSSIYDWKYKKYISKIDLRRNYIELNHINEAKIQQDCLLVINTDNIKWSSSEIYEGIGGKYIIENTQGSHIFDLLTINTIKESGKIHMIDRGTYLKWVQVDPEYTGLMYQEYCRYTFNKRIFLDKGDFDIEFRYY